MKDKLRLDYFLSVGGKLIAGDECRCKSTNRTLTFKRIIPAGESYPGNYEFTGFGRVVYMKCELDGFTITSFAERENTGVQPVPDRFPVVVNNRINQQYVSAHCAAYFNWRQSASLGCVTTWKPDYEALLKMQVEHDKHNESIIKACDEANRKESEMVYTQEMKDNGEQPKVGMKCDVEYKGLNTFSNAIIKFISDYGIVHADSETGVETFCGSIDAVDIHQIKTPEETQLEEVKRLQAVYYAEKYCEAINDIDTSPRSLFELMQENGDLPEIVVDDLSARGMAKQ